jgi:hypothetical protein
MTPDELPADMEAVVSERLAEEADVIIAAFRPTDTGRD